MQSATSSDRAGLDSYAVGEELCANPGNLPTRIEEITSKGIEGSELVLFLDQMEECFTSQALEYADDFLSALYQATPGKSLWLIATIRSDFLNHCNRHDDLLQVLRGTGNYPTGRIDSTFTANMIRY